MTRSLSPHACCAECVKISLSSIRCSLGFLFFSLLRTCVLLPPKTLCLFEKRPSLFCRPLFWRCANPPSCKTLVPTPPPPPSLFSFRPLQAHAPLQSAACRFVFPPTSTRVNFVAMCSFYTPRVAAMCAEHARTRGSAFLLLRVWVAQKRGAGKQKRQSMCEGGRGAGVQQSAHRRVLFAAAAALTRRVCSMEPLACLFAATPGEKTKLTEKLQERGGGGESLRKGQRTKRVRVCPCAHPAGFRRTHASGKLQVKTQTLRLKREGVLLPA